MFFHESFSCDISSEVI